MSRAAPYDREKSLDAALSVFWTKGYHATSLKDLETALAMKPGSIYAAFKSKENLYLLALERYFMKSRNGFRKQAENALSPLQILADHLRAFPALDDDDAAKQACMLTKTLVDTRSTDNVLADQTRQYMREMREEFGKVFHAALGKGELPDNADTMRLARRYQANLTALRLEIHQGTKQDELVQLADDMAREVEMLRP
ncbi:TetR/AcrR family transcriptional regulator [Sulfitobacter donghicola]|uniref:TetR family transcriptional regulator n=1 Tax=Sulfitobacter donghicola DSW-25 = KCTC 12864 = JCM 14565 TaxID=1300350 RepID=A0A073IJX8_9RHOB|nr:TetR/AcrR family transcriptional regulator [Sulfitobacter donghicola]KEJ90608.1 TetR family transcriptional regulator [Sulfitobacter donghicola DSW-25 = KCTC 12864 = JCM 14565]KIN67857.1 putative transcriptional regulator, TetR family protein [Sulfitobacter donghicola DSW-25 = KCTC 12864 = JCM 14565]